MPYREDLDAAVARIDALQAEQVELADTNRRLEHELAIARALVASGEVDLGGRRRSRNLAIAAAGVSIGVAVVVGAAIIRVEPAPPPPPTPRRCPAPPVVTPTDATTGLLFADGPALGTWTWRPEHCSVRDPGRGLMLTNSDGEHRSMDIDMIPSLQKPHVFISSNGGRAPIPVTELCGAQMTIALGKVSDTVGGWVDIDCAFAGNTLRGRIDISGCRSQISQ